MTSKRLSEEKSFPNSLLVASDQSVSDATRFYLEEVSKPDPPLFREGVIASRLVGECVDSLGFPSVGGEGIGFDVAPEQRDFLVQALESCQGALDELGYLADDEDEETWERRYNGLLETFDCLEEAGEHPQPPPSLEVYLETRAWSPLEGIVWRVDVSTRADGFSLSDLYKSVCSNSKKSSRFLRFSWQGLDLPPRDWVFLGRKATQAAWFAGDFHPLGDATARGWLSPGSTSRLFVEAICGRTRVKFVADYKPVVRSVIERPPSDNRAASLTFIP